MQVYNIVYAIPSIFSTRISRLFENCIYRCCRTGKPIFTTGYILLFAQAVCSLFLPCPRSARFSVLSAHRAGGGGDFHQVTYVCTTRGFARTHLRWMMVAGRLATIRQSIVQWLFVGRPMILCFSNVHTHTCVMCIQYIHTCTFRHFAVCICVVSGFWCPFASVCLFSVHAVIHATSNEYITLQMYQHANQNG